MKVWKSPVFYFGILLVIAITGLLAAPFVVDWNAYRADLEHYGKTLTGRAVKIDGPVTVRLFPWPRLTAEKVSIANPPGLDQKVFATADRIVVRITLAGLIGGSFNVESVDVEEPTINLERLATGEGNWLFQPSANLIKSDVLSRVKLDQIRLNGGTVNFRDRRRGETVTLDDFNANLDSPGVEGPWRLRSVSLYNDKAINISVNTGVYVEGEPFRFGVIAAPSDASGLAYSFDGAQNGGVTEGDIRIEPASAGDGKTDAEGRLRPLVFTAKVKADFDHVDLQKIEVAPRDPAQGGAITTGSASLKLGSHIDARVDLSAAMLDLDELAGAKSRDLLREAGSLALANSILRLLPAEMSLAGTVKLTALKTGGQTLDNVSLSLDADRNALRIQRFSSGLPGRSEMLFKGVYFPGDTGDELSGSLALESNDLRELAFWAWPEGQGKLGSVWTGNRGRFKMQTDVSLTAARLKLFNTQYELDGEQGKAELSVTSAGRGAVDLDIESARIDIDSLAPDGVNAFSAAAGRGIGSLMALVLPHADAPDLRLKIKANELLLNAVTARQVSLDLESGSNGLNLRGLDIGSVGGARLDAMGLVLDSGKGAEGSIGIDVKADDPTELLRLLGLVQGDTPAPWASGLGPTTLRGDIGVKPGDKGAQLSFGLDGTAGQLTLSGTGTAGPGAAISGDVKVSAPSSGRIMALFGLAPVGEDTAPGAVQVQAAGTLTDGFMANATVQAYGARLDYRGSANPLAAGLGLDGKLSLRSTDASGLIRATGIPASTVPGGVLVADTDISATPAGWSFKAFEGRLGPDEFKGEATLDAARKLEAHVEAGALKLTDVLAATFLDWSGAGPSLETGFASTLPFGITGEVWIKSSVLEVHPHFTAPGAEIGIMADGTEIRVALSGKDEQGRDAQIEVSSAGDGDSRKIAGRVYIPIDLARQLALVNGAPVAEGLGTLDVKFDSSGRSPGGALASVRGSGTYDIKGLRLPGLSPAAFNAALATAKDAPGITAAFDALRGGDGFAVGDISGTITVSDGEAAFLPFSLKTPEADVMVKTVAELALGEIDAEISLSLKAREGLPGMSVSYAGPPMALARSEDNTELATKLGVTLMQEGIDELERLQQEQKRLAAEEEKQRIADEERLAAYYAQRDELLLRKRELKVHAEMVVAEAERLRQQIDSERAANAEINKGEMKQRVREIRLYRKLARAAAAAPKPAPVQAKPVKVAPAEPAKPVQQGPVVLAQPEGAPVLIATPPGDSPSQ